MEFGIAGRKAVVTGASTGIGRAVALGLAAEGVELLVSSRDPGRLADAVAAVAATGARVHSVAADVGTLEGCRMVVDTALARLGQVDILVNNAGNSRPRPQGEFDTEGWWAESFALNFESARRITDGLLPGMRARGWGRVVTLTGAMTSTGPNAAGPAKAALWSWSRMTSVQAAPDGVTVNCVQPGRINTPQIVERLLPTPQARQAEIDRGIPIGRFGEPEELAALVVFLASEPARYITGTQIPVDGGLLRMALP
ncbi:MAG: SDR family oxidoreductase [Burkholderiaceae bacterium]|nr:SDR family oxidoreductase [Burkholderiaceae bacterium]